MKRKRHFTVWKKIHQWVGIMMTIFVLLFCLSGLVLNHRSLCSPYSVSRSVLPKSYHIEKYNNGLIKGTLPYGNKLLTYGNAGVWLTDRHFRDFVDFNNGLPKGADNRNIRHVVQTKDGKLWCAAQFGLYYHDGEIWRETDLPGNSDRIADITVTRDSCRVVALTRSAVYTFEHGRFCHHELKTPLHYDNKVSLFKTFWQLHSGELFGTVGRLVVDSVAIIIIFLCITGLILFALPYSIKISAWQKSIKARIFKWNFVWHNKIGYCTIALTTIVVFTGMCLRPPLMIPLVLTKMHPIPGSSLAQKNVWHDKLRGIRWDEANAQWLISTSEGFMHVGHGFDGAPKMLSLTETPPVSPMGINVFEPLDSGEWLIGSFIGLYRWNMKTGIITDYISGAKYAAAESRRPVSGNLVAGFSKDLGTDGIVFDYSGGTDKLGDTPEVLTKQPMSLWNCALELHVGRCYTPFLGPVSELFVFLSGIMLMTVLLSGLFLHYKHKQTIKT